MNRIRRLLAILLILLLLPLGSLGEEVIRLYAAEYPVEKSGWYSTMEEAGQLHHQESGHEPGLEQQRGQSVEGGEGQIHRRGPLRQL